VQFVAKGFSVVLDWQRGLGARSHLIVGSGIVRANEIRMKMKLLSTICLR
jgi:hypothetical protein